MKRHALTLPNRTFASRICQAEEEEDGREARQGEEADFLWQHVTHHSLEFSKQDSELQNGLCPVGFALKPSKRGAHQLEKGPSHFTAFRKRLATPCNGKCEKGEAIWVCFLGGSLPPPTTQQIKCGFLFWVPLKGLEKGSRASRKTLPQKGQARSFQNPFFPGTRVI